jgi:hypothetical protein
LIAYFVIFFVLAAYANQLNTICISSISTLQQRSRSSIPLSNSVLVVIFISILLWLLSLIYSLRIICDLYDIEILYISGAGFSVRRVDHSGAYCKS